MGTATDGYAFKLEQDCSLVGIGGFGQAAVLSSDPKVTLAQMTAPGIGVQKITSTIFGSLEFEISFTSIPGIGFRRGDVLYLSAETGVVILYFYY